MKGARIVRNVIEISSLKFHDSYGDSIDKQTVVQGNLWRSVAHAVSRTSALF